MTKPTQRLIALGRIPNANRYGTRHLVAGDEFEAGANDAKLLLLAKKAKPANREPVKLSAPPLIVTDKIAKKDRVKHEVDPTEQPPAVTQPQPAVTAVDPDGNPGSDFAPSGGTVTETAAAVSKPDDDASDELLAAARAEYSLKLGRRAFHGWDVEELRRRISEAE